MEEVDSRKISQQRVERHRAHVKHGPLSRRTNARRVRAHALAQRDPTTVGGYRVGRLAVPLFRIANVKPHPSLLGRDGRVNEPNGSAVQAVVAYMPTHEPEMRRLCLDSDAA